MLVNFCKLSTAKYVIECFFPAGVKEAHAAGKALKADNFKFDIAHTSVLTRANKTLDAILEEIGQKDIPIEKTWRLNERHYGGLTGLNKAETAVKHGEEQVGVAITDSSAWLTPKTLLARRLKCIFLDFNEM